MVVLSWVVLRPGTVLYRMMCCPTARATIAVVVLVLALCTGFWAVSASAAGADEVIVSRNVNVTMRDGAVLSADIYRPGAHAEAGRWPTLVMRTPYGKRGDADMARFFAAHGYAVVVQDVRGRGASAGVFYPYRSPHRNRARGEAEDSYDTIEWAAARPWSNARIGTLGASYQAATQMALLHNARLPPHLVTMAPGFVASSYYGQGAYAGGALLLSHDLDYLSALAVQNLARRRPPDRRGQARLRAARTTLSQRLWQLPVSPYGPLADVDIDWLSQGWFAHPTYDDYWRAQDHRSVYSRVDIPVLVYGGWYDIFDQGDIQTWQGIHDRARSAAARRAVSLVMGPYTHVRAGQTCQGAVNGHAYCFPDNARYDEKAMLLAWFDRQLKDRSPRASGDTPPPVRLYVPGLDAWVGGRVFPLAGTHYQRLYLSSTGNARVDRLAEPGQLLDHPPSAQPPDRYRYDPAHPVPTVAGFNTHTVGGVGDRSQAYGGRRDILVYQTPPLAQDLAVVGPITLTLYASTSAVSTDFDAVISDVAPNGSIGGLWVTEGVRRGGIGDVSADPRRAESYARRRPLVPGHIDRWEIALWPTARVFARGHRLRIDIASSNFPRYSRNLNTGEGVEGTHMITARQSVYHDAAHPSHLTLPVVPMTRLKAARVPGPLR